MADGNHKPKIDITGPDILWLVHGFFPSISPDGTKVVFESPWSDLVSGDTNGKGDIFIKDLTTGAVTLVSSSSSGELSNGESRQAVFSSDGSKVIFRSSASNLVGGASNQDIFVKDLTTGAITRPDPSSYSTWYGPFSPVGKVLFGSASADLVSGDTNGKLDFFIKDLATGVVSRISTDSSGGQSNGDSYDALASPDGRRVLFYSAADNLVADDTNHQIDLFVKDLVSGAIMRANTGALGQQGSLNVQDAVFSPDGTKVAFRSASTFDNQDSNGRNDIFVKDLITGALTRLSSDAHGNAGNFDSYEPVFLQDGTGVVFESGASNLVSGAANGLFLARLKDYVLTMDLSEDKVSTAGTLFSFSDADKTDSHTVTTAAVTSDNLGHFTATLSHDTTGSGTGGKVAWSYAVDNALVQYLKGGETRIERFTIRISDGKDTTEQAVALKITGVNDAPVLATSAASLADGLKGVAYELTRAQLLEGWADVDGEGLAISNVTADHGTIHYDSASDRYSLVPASGYAGTVIVRYSVTDSLVEVPASLSVHLAGNNAPELDGPAASLPDGLRDVVYRVTPEQLLQGWVDTEGDAVTVADVTADHGTVSYNSLTGSYDLMPDAFYVGPVVLSYKVTEPNNASPASLSVKINGNHIPVIVTSLPSIMRVSTNAAGEQAVGGYINPYYSLDSNPVISPDGTKVAFQSDATNLGGGGADYFSDIFVKDLITGAITLVSTGYSSPFPSRSATPVFSPDGSKVAFSQWNVFDISIYIKDLTTGTLTNVSTDSSGKVLSYDAVTPVFSPDGTKVAFATNYGSDIFIKDLTTGILTLVSTDATGIAASGGYSSNPVFSPDGTKLAFSSGASNLVAGDTRFYQDIFVKDLITGAITLVSTDSAGVLGNGNSASPVFSPDGSKVAFSSWAANLVDGDTNDHSDIFVKDLISGEVVRVSTELSGAQSYGDATTPVFSADGTRLAYSSGEIMVKDLVTGTLTVVSRGASGDQGNLGSSHPVFSPDGTQVVFASRATNLVSGDTNGTNDVFIAPVAIYKTTGSVQGDSTGTTGGSFGFSDADTGDHHAVSVAAFAGGTLGSLSAVLTHATSAKGTAGEVAWSYAVDKALLAYLKPGETKVETFSVRIGDGADITEQTVSVTLIGVNDAPALTGTPFSLADGLRDVAIDVSRAQLLQGWTDADGDVLSVGTISANHGSVRYDAGSDSYRLTPEAGYAGPVTIRYKVTDSQDQTAASLAVTLSGNNVPQFVTGATITRVSTNTAGEEGNNASSGTVFSPDSTKVAFYSYASNLVSGDSNGVPDIFVKDLISGVVTRVSADASGVQGNDASYVPVFSPDGRKVAFYSMASNLVDGDTNGVLDLFVKDLATGAITRVSTNSAGVQGDANSGDQAFSSDGTKVAFFSSASNLVSGDTNGSGDIFIKDLVTGVTTRASTNALGVQGNYGSDRPTFSPDGSKVVFQSEATNLVAGDTNGGWDIFVKDLVTGVVTLVSANASGAPGNIASYNAVFSPDGSKVAFWSYASNLVSGDTNGQADIFIKDLVTGAISRVSTNATGGQANGFSSSPKFSPDGTKVVFFSEATNLADGDTNGKADIFVKDLVTGVVSRLPADVLGVENNGDAYSPGYSPDGRMIAIESRATNLVEDDSNKVYDVFVLSLATYAVSGSVIEDGTTASAGKFGFSDRDALDTHTLSLLAAADGTLGTFVTSMVRDTAGAGSQGEISWSYTVDNALIQYLKAGETKVESFTVRVSDGEDAAEQTVSVTITGSNDAPVLTGPVAVLADGREDIAYTITRAQLLQGWTDIDGDSLNITGLSTNHGTVSYDALSDSFILLSPVNYVGPVVISYLVTDSHAEVAASLSVAMVSTLVTRSETTTLQAGEKRLVLTGWHSVNGTGNELDNVLTGNGGNNILTGLGGNDLLNGGKGGDRMVGGIGDDTYSVDSVGDVVVELADQGSDTVKTVIDGYMLADNVERLILMGPADIGGSGNELDNGVAGNGGDNRLSGGGGNDSLFGGLGADTLSGDAGHDLLDGGLGADSLAGGSGNDSYIVDSFDDLVSERAGEGSDTVKTRLDGYRLGAFVENLILTGAAAISGVGNALNNIIVGNGGDNDLAGYGGRDRLVGGRGNDRLDGGAGADAMYGGLGNDTYSVDDAGDQVVEGVGEGRDTVKANLDGYVLGANVEYLILTGSADLNGSGNALDNRLYGNGGDNGLGGGEGNDTLLGGLGDDSLNGGAGNDFLEGGAGSDTMAGGTGDDTYGVDALGDHFHERAGEGIDTVRTALDGYVLGRFVENLILTGSANVGGTGNGLDNVVTGNNGDNRLKGGGGNDTLTGAGGDDRLIGGAGADSMAGGLGDDTYDVDNLLDRVREYAGAGIDTVRSKLDTYSLGNNVDNLILTGSANISGVGNGERNVLTGNDGNNSLSGGAGSDTLYGGKGNDSLSGDDDGDVFDGGTGADTMVGGAGDDTFYVGVGDVVIEDAYYYYVDEGVSHFDSAYYGIDTVISALPHVILAAHVENLILTGMEDSRGTGNNLRNQLIGSDGNNVLKGLNDNDILIGNGGDDVLDGGKGQDQMDGGTGNDTYWVGGGDMIFEAADGGIDTVISTLASYQLGANLENVTLYEGKRALGAAGNDLDNVVTGNSKSNILLGGAGNDTIEGGGSADTLTGGAGRDVFLYRAVSDSLSKARDLITDMSADDRIDLHLIDADSAADGDQAFHLVGAFTGHAAEMVIRYDAGSNQTSLSLDSDGDGVAEFMLLMAGSHLDAAGWIL